MNTPKDLKFSKTDEWVKVEGKTAIIGITDYAQAQLSDIVFVEIPVEVGETVKQNATCATIESVKAAADVTLPISGKITAINQTLSQAPETMNSDPYGKAWLVKVEILNLAELDALLNAEQYEKYCQERSH